MKVEQRVEYYGGERGDFLRVVEARCDACGDCARFCSRGVWEKRGKIYEPVRLAACAECGACFNICRTDAVVFEEPPGGTGVRFTYG
jgi:MinD superfamily P-loop ATPase